MSFDSKLSFLIDLEKALSGVLTAQDLQHVKDAAGTLLGDYEMDRLPSSAGRDDLLEAYLSALQVEGRSQKTIKRYRYIMGRILTSIGLPASEITVYHLRRWLADEKARGISDRTLEGDRQILSSCFNWLQREGLIRQNPTANLGAIKCAKKIKQVFSEADIDRMKLRCSCVRDRAIIAFLLSTGCRISEMTQLDRTDVDLNRLQVTVLGKGNKERTVYLSQSCAALLQEYLKSRKDALPALFTGKGSERMTPQGVRTMLHKLEKDTGVEHIHPHKFRRTLATSLIHRGMAIQEVAAILGHDKLDTTMEYVVLDKTEVQNAYRKYA